MQQVYFAACGGRIKIGRSANPGQRLKEIGQHLFEDITLLASVRGSAALEHAIHKMISQHRIRGEWFLDCPEVRRVMADVIDRGSAAVSEFYRPINYSRQGNGQVRHVRDSKLSSSQNPWVLLLARIDDLLSDVGGGRHPSPAAITILRRARARLILINESATASASDEDAIDKATALVWDAQKRAEAAAGRSIRTVYTFNRRIAGLSGDYSNGYRVPKARDRRFVAGLTAGLA